MTARKSAIIFGATGLIGSELLQQLLASPAYARVIAVVRQDMGIDHPNLLQIIADYQSLADNTPLLVADDVFCCLGSTKKKTPEMTDYYAVDHDYPLAAAKITQANGARAFVLVSAVGANPESANFYLRIKGEVERDIQDVGFKQFHVFRPSMLTGLRREKRWLESVSKSVFRVIDPLLVGKLKRYRSISASAVASAMKKAVEQPSDGTFIYYWSDIRDLV